MNNGLIFLEIIIVFSMLVLAKKLFGKYGVILWIPIATLIANIITCKNAEIFGFETAVGSVMFASTFLATDILTECYGEKEAKTGVYLGLFSILVFVVSTQVTLRYIPSAIDFADGSMQTLFGLNLRISISSAVMYFIANMADIYLFSKIKEKTKGKYLWLRNNVATIVCNCLENFFFMLFAWVGIYSMNQILIIALSTSLIEAIVGVCDTPFLYLARRLKDKELV